MNISQSVETFRNELERRPLADLDQWAQDAERSGRWWLQALILDVMDVKKRGQRPDDLSRARRILDLVYARAGG